MRVAVIHGPNLNLLGTREPAIYGASTIDDIKKLLAPEAQHRGIDLRWFQSNHEGALIDEIQTLPATADGLILNAGALTHTSLAIRDALLAVAVPFIEVHISNLYAREPERQKSLTAGLSRGVIVGLGPLGYRLALEALHQILSGD